MGSSGQTRRVIAIGLSVVAIAMMVGVIVAVWRLNALGETQTGWLVGVIGAAAVAVAGLWILFGILDTHFDDVERLRHAVLVASTSSDGRLPPPREHAADDEVMRVREAVETLIARRLHPSATPDERLRAVLATLDEGIVAVTESGQISLVNAPAKAMLGGAQRVAVGNSVFGVLHRDGLLRAMAEAERVDGAVDWTLNDVDGHAFSAKVAPLRGHAGAVIRLTLEDLPPARLHHARAAGQSLDHDLSLHDTLPQASVAPDTALMELPMLVFDSETTGLDIRTDRMVQLGAVRVHGTRVFSMANVDRLINPGVPIPQRAIAVHGITNDMAAAAPPFAEAWEHLEPLMRGAVLVGHNIGFDIAILRRECALAGLPWPDPPVLDTLQLYSVLRPDEGDLNLETQAAYLGVDVHGRHTALGDALVTAEIVVRLLPLLEAAGVHTFAEAQAFAARATGVLAKQKAMGW